MAHPGMDQRNTPIMKCTGWDMFIGIMLTYQCSSVSVYKTIKPKELRGLFLPYHTLDPSQAIERILEAKGISENRELDIMHQYEVFRRIREA